MSVNPSVASGLGTCSEAQYAAETVNSAARSRLPERLQSRRTGDRKPAGRRPDRRLDVLRDAARKPLRHPAGALPRRQVARARDHGQGRRQGRLRSGHRSADHHLRRPAPAALLTLQRALSRRPAQPAGDPVGVRQLQRPKSPPARGWTRARSSTRTRPSLSRRAPGGPPARRASRPSSRAPSPAPGTRTPPPTPPSTCT